MHIFKYAIPPESAFVLDLPADARILSVQVQKGTPSLWAMVDPSAPTLRWHFEVHRTDREVGNVGRFVETFQLSEEYHLFEAQYSGGDSEERSGRADRAGDHGD